MFYVIFLELQHNKCKPNISSLCDASLFGVKSTVSLRPNWPKLKTDEALYRVLVTLRRSSNNKHTHANMALYTRRSITATDRFISFFHDATLSVHVQQTLMFIQAELLQYEFHHQDNDDITEAGPPSQSFISETLENYFDVIINAVALFLDQEKRIWKHLIVMEECQMKWFTIQPTQHVQRSYAIKPPNINQLDISYIE